MDRLHLPYMARKRHLDREDPNWQCRFRHPLLGRAISLTASTQDDHEALTISKSLSELIQNSHWHDPKRFEEAARTFHPRAVHVFFEPMPGVPKPEATLHEALDEVFRLRCENAMLRRKLTSVGEGSAKGLTPSINAEIQITEAYKRWVDDFDCRSARERKFVLRRVKFAIETIAHILLSKVTAPDVQRSIQASMSVARAPRKTISTSAHELNRRIRDTKRFLAWCFEVYCVPSLRKVIISLRFSTPETIARRQEVEILEMSAVAALLGCEGKGAFESEFAAIVVRALVGVLVYCGLRLGELCSLRWVDVDFKQQLISAVDTAIKELKTLKSNRVIRPLPELWPLLNRLHAITGKFDFVFPYENRGKFENKSWLLEEDGKMVAKLLTRKLIREESAIGLGRKIPMRARRTCRNLMLTRGVPSHVVDLMLGHSADVGRAHYTHVREVVSAFQYSNSVVAPSVR